VFGHHHRLHGEGVVIQAVHPIDGKVRQAMVCREPLLRYTADPLHRLLPNTLHAMPRTSTIPLTISRS
jgi:hypothetical protein